MSPSQKWLGVGCAVAVLCIWSSFILIARSSAKHTLTPFDIAFLRFLFSGLAVLPLLLWRFTRIGGLVSVLGGVNLRRTLQLGAIAGVGYCCLAYTAFFLAPAAHGSVLLPGSLPLWTALLAAALLGERIQPWRAAGLTLIVLGDLMVGATSLLLAFRGGDVWKGDLLFLATSLTWALYTVLCRKWRIGAVEATVAVAFSCLITFVPLYALGASLGLWPSRLAEASWRELGFQAVYQGGIAMLIAGVAYTQVVTTFGPMRTVMITALVPVISALGAVPLLGEPLTPTVLIGLGFVTLGLLLGLRAVRPRLPIAEPA